MFVANRRNQSVERKRFSWRGRSSSLQEKEKGAACGFSLRKLISAGGVIILDKTNWSKQKNKQTYALSNQTAPEKEKKTFKQIVAWPMSAIIFDVIQTNAIVVFFALDERKKRLPIVQSTNIEQTQKSQGRRKRLPFGDATL